MKLLVKKVCISIFVAWTMKTLAHRCIMVQQYYRLEMETIQEDNFFCGHSCNNGETIARIGRHGLNCSRACTNGKKEPSYGKALAKTLKETYLCGDNPCSHIWQNFTSNWRGMFGVILYLLFAPAVLWELVQYLSGVSSVMMRNRKRIEFDHTLENGQFMKSRPQNTQQYKSPRETRIKFQ